MFNEMANAEDSVDAGLVRAGGVEEKVRIHGRFEVECRDKDGNLKWKDTIDNTTMDAGVRLALDTFLAGSGYTAAVYMGLISSDTYSAINAADTMASHAGWREAGGSYAPTYTTRKTCAWAAASSRSKALSAALPFTFTGGGTVKGAFLVYGSGASATVDNTGGVLYSAGLFTGGDKVVIATDILNVSYTASM